MPNFTEVLPTDTFEQWRLKTNALHQDLLENSDIELSNDDFTTTNGVTYIANGSITNDNVALDAAIEYSKIDWPENTSGDSYLKIDGNGILSWVSTSHTHALADINGLVTELAGKADTVHTHATSDITGLDTTLTNLDTTLAGKADTVHTHVEADITDLDKYTKAQVDAKLEGLPVDGHTHALADITGLDAALAGKSDTNHTHELADINGLDAALSGKADTGHTHALADITDFGDSLDTNDFSYTDGTLSLKDITNDHIASNAAIAYSKLNLTDSIVNADVASNAAIDYTKIDFGDKFVLNAPDGIDITSGKTRINTVEYTWPSGAIAGRYLKTDATGNLTWDEIVGGEGSVDLASLVFNDIVPVGTIIPWAGVTLPSDEKWLVCNGDEVSSTTYAELAELLGITYGEAAEGYVKLPDLGGRIPVGVGGELNKTIGTPGGSISQSISGTTGEHTLTAAQSGLPEHTHTYTLENPVGSGSSAGSANGNSEFNTVETSAAGGTDATEGHSHTLSGSVDVTQPYVTTQYIIKVLPDDVQQVAITAGNGINVKDAGGEDNTTIDLFSTELELKVDAADFEFSGSGLLQLKDKTSTDIENELNPTTTVPTTQAVKDYVDASGGSSFYQDIDNLEKFDQVANTEYTYQLSNFTGTGYDASKVNGIYVECYMFTGAGGSSGFQASIQTNLGGGTEFSIIQQVHGYNTDDESGNGTLVFIPISIGQTSFKLKSTLNGDNTIGKRKGWRIVGVSQIDGFVGGGSSGGGSSGGGSSSSLLRYGEIQVGDIGTGGTNVTTTGDFTATKTNGTSTTDIICTFNTPLPNTNYNVIIEKISLSNPDLDGDLKSHVIYNKSATGFSIKQDETDGIVQNLQFNVRIESTEATPVVGGGDAVLQENGYEILPSGMIMQWGYAARSTYDNVDIPFTTPFINNVFNIQVTDVREGDNGQDNSAVNQTETTLTKFQVNINAGNVGIYWQAIGN